MGEGADSVGVAIRTLLADRGWRQVDLADVLGHSTAFVSDVINGKRRVSPGLAQRLASAFEGTTPEYWYGFRLAAERDRATPNGAHRLVPLRTCPVHGSPWRDHSHCGESANRG